MNETKNLSCRTCKYWIPVDDKSDSATSECRRFPPTIKGAPGIDLTRPPVVDEVAKLVALSASVEGALVAIAHRVASGLPSERARAVESVAAKHSERCTAVLNDLRRLLELMPELSANEYEEGESWKTS